MPIDVPKYLRLLSQPEYHELNHRVLGVVFDVHNEYGRLCDEAVYKGAIAERWGRIGKVEREVPIRLTHGDFAKTYKLDLFFEDGLMVEAKTADLLTGKHQAQTLNYMLAAGIQHATLLNLRNARVEHEFVSTQLTPVRRRDILVEAKHWKHDPESDRLADCAEGLLRDWGAFLELALYREAIIHLLRLGAPQPVAIMGQHSEVGQQPMTLCGENAALACTALTEDSGGMREQLARLLSHTKLDCFHWLNFNHSTLELTTVTRG